MNYKTDVIKSYKTEIIIYQDGDSLADVLKSKFSGDEYKIESGRSNTGLNAVRVLAETSRIDFINEIEKEVNKFGMAEIEVKMIRYV